ncbi:MAG TPA: BatD family protein [Polyangia bacterium]|nr:BatD family protein [Polyangia bacterium]
MSRMPRVALFVLAGAALAIVGAAPPARAQAPSFVAELDRNTVGAGDTFTYQVTLNAANESIDGFQPPAFGGLRVLSAPRGPSRSTQMQIGGGGTFIQNSYSWVFQLAGTQKGAVNIGPARVRVDGREMKSNTVNLRVVDAGAGAPAPRAQRSRSPFAGFPGFFDDEPDPQADPQQQQQQQPQQQQQQPAESEPSRPPAMSSAPAGNFIRAVPDKTRAFVGEQVTVSWYLYITQRVDKYEPKTEAHTDGFWSDDITPPVARGQLSLHNETVGGRAYQVALLSRKALFPLQPGKLTVTPLEAEIAQVDFFGATLRRQGLKTEPITIEAVPLPKAGQPADFDAASVGKFAIAAHVDRATVGVGEAVTLTVEVKGQGNLRNLRVPALPPLDGWKAYPPKSSLSVQPGEVMGGSKTVEYLLLPERPGTTMLTSLTLPYFDPEAKAYAVAKTDPLRLEVTGDAAVAGHAGTAGGAGGPAQSPSAGAPAENVIGAEIRPIRAPATLKRDLGTTFYRSSGFRALLLLPPLGFGATVLVARLRERLGGNTERTRRRRARQLVRRRLSAAEQHRDAGRAGDLYIEIERVLRDLLAARLGCSVTGLRMDELGALLRARGLPDETVARVVAELEECDLARFAPGSGGGGGRERMSASLDRAAELIEVIEKAPLREETA